MRSSNSVKEEILRDPQTQYKKRKAIGNEERSHQHTVRRDVNNKSIREEGRSLTEEQIDEVEDIMPNKRIRSHRRAKRLYGQASFEKNFNACEVKVARR